MACLGCTVPACSNAGTLVIKISLEISGRVDSGFSKSAYTYLVFSLRYTWEGNTVVGKLPLVGRVRIVPFKPAVLSQLFF